MQSSKPWLGTVAWEDVVARNDAICQEKNVDPKPNQALELARKRWEAARGKTTTLLEAVDLCRSCSDLRPFVFNCTNTFARIARDLIEPWAQQLNSVEGEMFRRSVAHYVDGQIQRRELIEVIQFMEKRPLVKKPVTALPESAPPILPPVQRHRQPA